MDDEDQPIKSPIKRYGSTRKIYLFNSKYSNKFHRLSAHRWKMRAEFSPTRRSHAFIRAGCIWLVNHGQCKHFPRLEDSRSLADFNLRPRKWENRLIPPLCEAVNTWDGLLITYLRVAERCRSKYFLVGAIRNAHFITSEVEEILTWAKVRRSNRTLVKAPLPRCFFAVYK